MTVRYKDTIAAKGSALRQAIEDNDMKKAEAIYQECEAEYNKHRIPNDHADDHHH